MKTPSRPNQKPDTMKTKILSITAVFLLITVEPGNTGFNSRLPANLQGNFKGIAYEVTDDWSVRKVKNGIQVCSIRI
jgi:hypothetical protein